jgi:hypothetical protein
MIRAASQRIRRLTHPVCLLGWVSLGITLGGTIGCTSLGPARVHSDRFDYNKAGARSANEQILLNIIRLRYREPIYFVEVNSMLSQYTFQANANYQAWWNDLNVWPNPLVRAVGNVDGDPSEQTQVGGNLGYTDRPTITYAPLQGKDFAQRVLSPIPAPTIIYLSQSGWDIDQLLECCVQRLNDVRNTPIHDVREGDLWDTVTFEQVAKLLKQMQDAGKLNLTVEIDPENNNSYLSIPAVTDETQAAAEQLSKLLDLEAGIQRIRLIEAGVSRPGSTSWSSGDDDIGTWNISHNNRGMMGYRTPNIDRIAKEGVSFTDYYGQQSCTAGRAAFINGSVPVRTGMTKVGMPGAQGRLAEDGRHDRHRDEEPRVTPPASSARTTRATATSTCPRCTVSMSSSATFTTSTPRRSRRIAITPAT